MRTLLVEDDPLIGEAICQTLRDAGYAVDWTTDGRQAATALRTQRYEVVLLDLGLPGKDGLEVLREARRNGNAVPVLVITARSAVEDRIAGLDLGADDYLVKPFHVGELLARLRALTRRQGQEVSSVLRNGALALDQASHEVWYQGIQRQLSAREFALLREFLLRPGVILSRNELEERIYGWNEEVESNAVEFLLHGVRKKLDAGVIKNIRGVGWMVPKAE
ncbi:two component transcriptional regulator, winged helix family protein [Cupriavidus basilensis OR16]|uniref:Two component transcriptional regulator, winged helix family protein n=1 Tax=Cupriavidus basilensis OR16 TaxID=1127483 RepID=H1S6X4_9BURK|nr:response regulator transcription factor [Cupriavidus basilensis]EHP41785.1 two component transcriptional regulator, winged helix family protein [Cupriavidus basilensis OR16]